MYEKLLWPKDLTFFWTGDLRSSFSYYTVILFKRYSTGPFLQAFKPKYYKYTLMIHNRSIWTTPPPHVAVAPPPKKEEKSKREKSISLLSPMSYLKQRTMLPLRIGKNKLRKQPAVHLGGCKYKSAFHKLICLCNTFGSEINWQNSKILVQ